MATPRAPTRTTSKRGTLFGAAGCEVGVAGGGVAACADGGAMGKGATMAAGAGGIDSARNWLARKAVRPLPTTKTERSARALDVMKRN